jgi:hypothetical protein
LPTRQADVPAQAGVRLAGARLARRLPGVLGRPSLVRSIDPHPIHHFQSSRNYAMTHPGALLAHLITLSEGIYP